MSQGIKNSEQTVLNTSFDESYNVLAVELLTHNPIEDTMERVSSIQGNGAITLGYTGSNLTTITKTIGSISYQKTLAYTGAVLDSVSAWVKL